MRNAMTAHEQSGVILSAAGHEKRRKAEAKARGGAWKRRLWRALPYVIGLSLIGGGAYAAKRLILEANSPSANAPAAAGVALQLETARKDAIDAEGRARAAETELAEAKQQLAAVSDKKKDADAKAAAAAAAQREKLSGAAGQDAAVTQDGDAIKLELVDKVLFKLNDADLTPRGQKVLDHIAAALVSMPDKQIFVQGHTDDTPITPAEGVTPKFATNWELSAARALTVVHYLQDVAGVDPKQLAAVAFGEYRPVSKKSKAKNRRIEIVLYPKLQVARD
jgi:flagellar motor protein MotB